MATHADILQAVYDRLDAGSWSLTPDTLVREAAPVVDLERLAEGLHLYVSPGPRSTVRVSRGSTVDQYAVHLTILRRTAASDQEQTDALEALWKEISANFLAAGRIGTAGARCMKIETVEHAEPGFSPTVLKACRVWYGAMRLHFR